MYAADLKGSLYPKEFGPWNLSNLPELLTQTLSDAKIEIDGFTCPLLYVATDGSFFSPHIEDYSLLSANFMHDGGEKIWYVIAPSEGPAMEEVINKYYGPYLDDCQHPARHKCALITPEALEKKGIHSNVVSIFDRIKS